jgi:hypothetical protein
VRVSNGERVNRFVVVSEIPFWLVVFHSSARDLTNSELNQCTIGRHHGLCIGLFNIAIIRIVWVIISDSGSDSWVSSSVDSA